MYFYGRILLIISIFVGFPPLPLTLVEHMLMNSITNPLIGCFQGPIALRGLDHHSVMCWQCVHIFLGIHIHSVFKFITFQCDTTHIMLICGLHWHSRYSIVDFYIYFMHCHVVYREFLWLICNYCVQNYVQMKGLSMYNIEISLKLVSINQNSLYTSHFSHYSVNLCNLFILIISHVSHVPNGFKLMGISPKYHLLTVQHTFICISIYFYWFCDMWHPPVKWLWLV